jgi:protein-disulfide isomerase
MTSRRALLALAASAAAITAAAPALAQQAARRPDSTLTGALLEELNRPGPLGDQVLGRADAPVTIIEYASKTCGHCATFHTDTLPRLKAEFIDTGRVRLIYREFPLDPLAAGAAMLARCAPEGRFFPLTDVLYQTQRNWAASNDPVAALLQIARQAGFTQESFEACLRNQQLLDAVQSGRDTAQRRFGVNSTPTLFINGQMFRGALRFDEIERIVTPMLRS